MTDEFRNKVQEFMSLDNQIKQADKALKTLKNRKNVLKLDINTYMRSNEIDELKLNDCKLKTYTSTSRGGITKDWIYKRLLILCRQDENQARSMCDFICDPEARPKKQTESIKRIAFRKKKVLIKKEDKN